MPLVLGLLLASSPIPHLPTADARPGDYGRLSAPPEAVRTVVAAIVRAAEENAKDPKRGLRGDALADLYIRKAAEAAQTDNLLPQAFLLALGVALDSTDTLRDNPLVRPYLVQVETEAERMRRLSVLGKPTLRGRADWLTHFAISAALTAQLGPDAAERLGIIKELWDARRSSGFSFADLTADYAGIALARALQEKGQEKRRLRALAEQFRGKDYFPDVADLEDGLPWDRFIESYGDLSDPRFRRRREMILERITRAPGWQDR